MHVISCPSLSRYIPVTSYTCYAHAQFIDRRSQVKCGDTLTVREKIFNFLRLDSSHFKFSLPQFADLQFSIKHLKGLHDVRTFGCKKPNTLQIQISSALHGT